MSEKRRWEVNELIDKLKTLDSSNLVRIRIELTQTFRFKIKDVFKFNDKLIIWTNGLYRIIEGDVSNWHSVQTVGELMEQLNKYDSDLNVGIATGNYVFENIRISYGGSIIYLNIG